MSKIEILRNRRCVILKQMDRISEFVSTQADKSTVAEVTTRLEALENVFSAFLAIQSKIEDADPEEVLKEERATYDEMYYSIRPKMQTILGTRETKSDDSVVGTHRSVSEQLKLPKANLPIFSGEITGWLTFYETFHSLVHSKSNLSNVCKFHYLLGALTDNVAMTIKSLEITDANYEVALKMLVARYENKKLIVNEHLRQIFETPAVQKNSASSLRNLIDSTNVHLRSLSSLGPPVQHWDDMIVFILTSKLDSTTLMKWQEESPSDRSPSLQELMKFLNKRGQILEGMVSPITTNKVSGACKVDSRTRQSSKSLTVTSDIRCALCSKQGHTIMKCFKLLRCSPSERRQQVSRLKLCINCLKGDHNETKCTSVNCHKCGARHYTLLHNDSSTTALDPNVNEYVPNHSTAVSLHSAHKETSTILATAIVHVVNHQDVPIPCRALLDSASQINFITEQFAQRIESKRIKFDQTYSGISSFSKQARHKTFVRIQSRLTPFSATIEAIILPKITGFLPSEIIPLQDLIIPPNLSLADPCFQIPQRIDLLIGAELFFSLLLSGQLQLENNITILQNTTLGWIISGSYRTSAQKKICNLVLNAKEEDNLVESLKRFWEIEERSYPPLRLTKNEIACEQHFIKSTKRIDGGRYQVRLPFKEDPLILGNSYNNAVRRLLHLERKFKKNDQLRAQYTSFMNEYTQLGHMELTDCVNQSEPHFYLPHHCILKPNSSTTKLRVVFDGSCKTDSGKSLNDVLMVGPVVQPDLFTISLRFRLHRYVFSADITKMYRQVVIDSADRNFQLILWRQSEQESIKTFRLCTVTYGTASAAYLSTRTLNHLASDEAGNFPLASNSLLTDFYVDDVLSGSDSLEEVLQLQNELKQILKRGGFELNKWCANDPELLANIPVDQREPYLNVKGNNVIKTLGLIWEPQSDVFMYKVKNLADGRITKRSVLSEISQLFDPLGLINPVIVLAKIFLQHLWKAKVDWDETLPSEYYHKWLSYRKELLLLERLRVPRLAISHLKENAQIHAFADSSELAYGTCIYVRSLNADGTISVNLLAARSRVAPVKKTSLPRLELCAAVMMAQFVNRLMEILKITFNKICYWTDSSIVLSWISGESSKWKTYVANRVATIQDTTTLDQWHHIESKLNPADIVSRGARPSILLHSREWFRGPQFLKRSENLWPCHQSSRSVDEALLEKRKVNLVLLAALDSDFITRIKFHTSYRKLLRVFVYVNRFKNNALAEKRKIEKRFGPITVDELKEALCTIVKIIQQQSFEQELICLRKDGNIPTKSHLKSLSPFLDDSGILRVGGRIGNSYLEFSAKHPILLPKSHVITLSICRYLHEKHAHAGPQNLLAIVRQMFWPVNGKVTCRKIVNSCILCFRCRPTSFNQIMGDLPSSRVLPARPFSTTGVDFCGPFGIHYRRRGASATKAYVAVFVCFVTRAVHLELVEDLTQASFMAALKRFVGRRGLCDTIYSDNGLNFVGAKNELHDIYKFFMHHETNNTIIDLCASDGIKWKTIPPRSPHMGGLWEAAVKSAKFHMKRLFRMCTPTHDEFSTALIQIEAILNSRPLTALSNDPNDLNVLTPGHFLIGGPLTAIVEKDITDDNLNRLSRWQRLQWVTQQFWIRWSSEYLQGLQRRNKWTSQSRRVNIGSLVVLKDDNLPPLKWRMGRIIELHPGKDNVVRVVSIKTHSSIVKRAIATVCVLPIEESSILQGGEHVN